ncbi:hypothetical protein [Methylophaga thiooxydans]|uniref:hypothetical protein n=1 Tax=Methylophaga thiooxydans TaxID=392484 RepID=UPI002355A105|nr:hypothetical protein [Methylophaga thiooxydans]
MLKTLLLATFLLPAFAQAQSFDFDTVNGVAIGQSIEQLKQHYPQAKTAKNQINTECYYVEIPKIEGVQWMVIDGIVARADISTSYKSPTLPVVSAFITGQLTPEQAASRYTNIELDDHEYQQGYRVSFINANGDRAVVADYVNNKVENVRIGLIPAAMFIEGCA